MSGFQYLMLSSAVIAFATLVSVNHEQMQEDGSLSVLFSLQGFCRSVTLQAYSPVPIECDGREDARRFSVGETKHGFDRHRAKEIIQINR